MPNSPVKQATKLPNREVLKRLQNSNMSINDYAKATPVKATEMEMSPLLQALRAEQMSRR
jgi:hypothetical protein